MIPSGCMSSIYLRACAAQWLRYDRQCPLVTFERGLKEYHGYNAAPDVLAVTKKRFLVEIEIKISMADFKANFKKRIHFMQARGYYKKPHEYWFLVPPHLVDKVKESELITCEGILTVGGRPNGYSDLPSIVEVRAPVINKKTPKVSVTQAMKMVKNQSGAMVSMLIDQARVAHYLSDLQVAI